MICLLQELWSKVFYVFFSVYFAVIGHFRQPVAFVYHCYVKNKDMYSLTVYKYKCLSSRITFQ